MKAIKNITLILLSTLWICSCDSIMMDVSHKTEKIHFTSGKFEVYGELRTPKGNGKHPLVIMVHGDGPARMTYFSKLKEIFLRAGYATLMWDKPGWGKSSGEFSNDHLKAERADILIDAIDEMKNHPKIQGDKIGVWGISQAGYVFPRALDKNADIAFIILVGVAGETGIRQTAYYIRAQLMCQGVTEEEAKKAESRFIGLYYVSTYDEYLECAQPLVDDPKVKEMGFVTAIWPEDQWNPKDRSSGSFYDPIQTFEKTNIPTLVFFGELDKNVNPVQGKEAFENALEKAGNPKNKVILIEGTDHNIIISESGCEKERRNRSGSGWSDYDPRYLKIMGDWLKGL